MARARVYSDALTAAFSFSQRKTTQPITSPPARMGAAVETT